MKSDTPRTDAQAKHCEDLCSKMEWRSACEAVLHVAYWCEIMEPRARRNGRIAWGMRRKLAAMTKERDALADVIVRSIGSCIIYHKYPTRPPCRGRAVTDDVCQQCVIEWAKQQAAKAGKESAK